MLAELTQWLLNLVRSIFAALWDFVTDVVISILELIINAFVGLVSLIPVPDWLSNGLASAWSGMDSGVLYVVTQCGVPAALAIIGGGYAFRLARKFFTLFQW